jgi:hypothetical protein
MAKNFFFVPGIVFFRVNNLREVKEFVSTTVVLSLVLPVRSLPIQYGPYSIGKVFYSLKIYDLDFLSKFMDFQKFLRKFYGLSKFDNLIDIFARLERTEGILLTKNGRKRQLGVGS